MQNIRFPSVERNETRPDFSEDCSTCASHTSDTGINSKRRDASSDQPRRRNTRSSSTSASATCSPAYSKRYDDDNDSTTCSLTLGSYDDDDCGDNDNAHARYRPVTNAAENIHRADDKFVRYYSADSTESMTHIVSTNKTILFLSLLSLKKEF